MSVHEIINFIAAVGVVAVFLYWHIRERGLNINHQRSGHTLHGRRIIRLLMPAFGLLLLLQLMGIIKASIPVGSEWSRVLFAIGHAMFWLGVLLSVWARETMKNNWAHAADYQVLPDQKLVTEGPFRYIRHPIYTALFLIFLGIQVALTSWFLLLVFPLLAFLYWQSTQEEELLQKTFGDAFGNYKERTGRFFPRSG